MFNVTTCLGTDVDGGSTRTDHNQQVGPVVVSRESRITG